MESSGICLAFEQYADAEAQCPGTVSAATCASQGFTLGTCAMPEGAAPVPVEGWFHPDMYTAAAAEEICAGAGGTWN
jgi:hypothetical protein